MIRRQPERLCAASSEAEDARTNGQSRAIVARNQNAKMNQHTTEAQNKRQRTEYETNPVYLPRQYMQKPDGGIHTQSPAQSKGR